MNTNYKRIKSKVFFLAKQGCYKKTMLLCPYCQTFYSVEELGKGKMVWGINYGYYMNMTYSERTKTSCPMCKNHFSYWSVYKYPKEKAHHSKSPVYFLVPVPKTTERALTSGKNCDNLKENNTEVEA